MTNETIDSIIVQLLRAVSDLHCEYTSFLERQPGPGPDYIRYCLDEIQDSLDIIRRRVATLEKLIYEGLNDQMILFRKFNPPSEEDSQCPTTNRPNH